VEFTDLLATALPLYEFFSVRSNAPSVPYVARMVHGSARLEVLLPEARKNELAALANECGLSSSDLAG